MELFANVHSTDDTHSGTVEFRGGSQFRTATGTFAWVAFVLSFVTLSLHENLIDNVPMWKQRTDTSMNAWWGRIRESAKKSKLSRSLPEDYRSMQRM
ncbi:hypothetical protein QBC41DRAFT_303943 [Cercophora samala]|uniref:Uncharacterized protein n=1 Tax=Cercophora samala TaxID=330535 RepID=A0AA39ZBH3_9PEZI|nr:hypothetical protein QBC41DRAFT_303943 [Cercophora samala]